MAVQKESNGERDGDTKNCEAIALNRREGLRQLAFPLHHGLPRFNTCPFRWAPIGGAIIARFVSYESPFDQCPYPPKVVCKDSKSWGFSASPPPCIIRASGRSLANLSWLASATEARYVV